MKGRGLPYNTIFFMLLLALHLVPIWAFTHFPSEDGPSHINNANVIRAYHHPDRAIFRAYYVLNRRPMPNWFSHIVMAELMAIVPALIAEKILLSGYILLLPLALRYVCRTLRPGAESFAFLAFPFIYNFPFHKGFYNFSYSLPLGFFVIGYWLKYHERFALREAVALGGLSLVLYFCHIVSLGMAYIAIALLGIWLIACDLRHQLRERQGDCQKLWQLCRTRLLIPFGVSLPSLLLAALFPVQGDMLEFGTTPFLDSLKAFLNMSSLVSLAPGIVWLTRALTGLFALLCAVFLLSKIVQRRWHRWDGLLLVVLVYVVMYFAISEGGFFLQSRLGLYPFLMLLPWFAAQAFDRKIQHIVTLTQGISVAIALMLLGIYSTRYAALNDYLREYVSGAHLIEPNTTLLPLVFSYTGYAEDGRPLASKVGSFHFASGYIAAQRGIVNFDNYEANTHFFPVMFRPALNPFEHIMDFLRRPLAWAWKGGGDFLTYPQRTGGQVDYVLVWGLSDEQRWHELTRLLFYQLEQGYELLYTSPQRGLMQLYRRKDWRATVDRHKAPAGLPAFTSGSVPR
jgi:hypothetical protein